MFWILRRTGAANFFNAINNNYSSKSNQSNNNISTEKNNSKPQRRGYGRLSVDSDDNHSLRQHSSALIDFSNDHLFDPNKKLKGEREENDDYGNNEHFDSDSDLELDLTIKNETNNHRINGNTITRLQAMAISDEDDYDESLTCNVCDRAFHCHRQLASHQQKKRHFGCSGCDSLFPSLMLLEHHKEEFEHWSDTDEENSRLPCCRRNRGDDFTDTDTATSDAESEDLERLL